MSALQVPQQPGRKVAGLSRAGQVGVYNFVVSSSCPALTSGCVIDLFLAAEHSGTNIHGGLTPKHLTPLAHMFTLVAATGQICSLENSC